MYEHLQLCKEYWLGWALSHYENDKCSHTLQIQTEWTFIMKTLIQLMHCVANVGNGCFIIKTNWLLFHVGLSIINISWSVQHSSLENCSHSDNRVTRFTLKPWFVDPNTDNHSKIRTMTVFVATPVPIFSPEIHTWESSESHFTLIRTWPLDKTIFNVFITVPIPKECTNM